MEKFRGITEVDKIAIAGASLLSDLVGSQPG